MRREFSGELEDQAPKLTAVVNCCSPKPSGKQSRRDLEVKSREEGDHQKGEHVVEVEAGGEAVAVAGVGKRQAATVLSRRTRSTFSVSIARSMDTTPIGVRRRRRARKLITRG